MVSPERLTMDLKMGELFALSLALPNDRRLKVSKTAIVPGQRIWLFQVPLKEPFALPYPG
jgi:hypothetical protein